MNGDMLDTLLATGIKNDAALAKRLRTSSVRISKIRSERNGIGPTLMIIINEEFDISIADIKAIVAKGRPA